MLGNHSTLQGALESAQHQLLFGAGRPATPPTPQVIDLPPAEELQHGGPVIEVVPAESRHSPTDARIPARTPDDTLQVLRANAERAEQLARQLGAGEDAAAHAAAAYIAVARSALSHLGQCIATQVADMDAALTHRLRMWQTAAAGRATAAAAAYDRLLAAWNTTACAQLQAAVAHNSSLVVLLACVAADDANVDDTLAAMQLAFGVLEGVAGNDAALADTLAALHTVLDAANQIAALREVPYDDATLHAAQHAAALKRRSLHDVAVRQTAAILTTLRTRLADVMSASEIHGDGGSRLAAARSQLRTRVEYEVAALENYVGQLVNDLRPLP